MSYWLSFWTNVQVAIRAILEALYSMEIYLDLLEEPALADAYACSFHRERVVDPATLRSVQLASSSEA